jgi:hypothetical protein
MKKCTIDTLSIDFIGLCVSTLFFLIIYKKNILILKIKIIFVLGVVANYKLITEPHYHATTTAGNGVFLLIKYL